MISDGLGMGFGRVPCLSWLSGAAWNDSQQRSAAQHAVHTVLLV